MSARAGAPHPSVPPDGAPQTGQPCHTVEFVVLEHGLGGTHEDLRGLEACIRHTFDQKQRCRQGALQQRTGRDGRCERPSPQQTTNQHELIVLNHDGNDGWRSFFPGIATCGSRLVEFVCEGVSRALRCGGVADAVCEREKDTDRSAADVGVPDPAPGFKRSCGVASREKGRAAHNTKPGMLESSLCGGQGCRWRLVFHFVGFSMGGLVVRAALPALQLRVDQLCRELLCGEVSAAGDGYADEVTWDRSGEAAEVLSDEKKQRCSKTQRRWWQRVRGGKWATDADLALASSRAPRSSYVQRNSPTTVIPTIQEPDVLSVSSQHNSASGTELRYTLQWSSFISLSTPHLGCRIAHPWLEGRYRLAQMLNPLPVQCTSFADLLRLNAHVEKLLQPQYLSSLRRFKQKVFIGALDDRVVWNYSSCFLLPITERALLHGWHPEGPVNVRYAEKAGRAAQIDVGTHEGMAANRGGGALSALAAEPWLYYTDSERHVRHRNMALLNALHIHPSRNLDEMLRHGAVARPKRQPQRLPPSHLRVRCSYRGRDESFVGSLQRRSFGNRSAEEPDSTAAATPAPSDTGGAPRVCEIIKKMKPPQTLEGEELDERHEWITEESWPHEYLPQERRMAKHFLATVGPVEVHLVDYSAATGNLLDDWLVNTIHVHGSSTTRGDPPPPLSQAAVGGEDFSYKIAKNMLVRAYYRAHTMMLEAPEKEEGERYGSREHHHPSVSAPRPSSQPKENTPVHPPTFAVGGDDSSSAKYAAQTSVPVVRGKATKPTIGFVAQFVAYRITQESGADTRHPANHLQT